MSKYHSRKVRLDGMIFDSQMEARRYQELKLIERAGKIKDLVCQPKFSLIPTIRREGHKTLRCTNYYADFKYIDCETGKEVVEDVKGFETDVYKLKKKLLLWRYPDLDFREIKR